MVTPKRANLKTTGLESDDTSSLTHTKEDPDVETKTPMAIEDLVMKKDPVLSEDASSLKTPDVVPNPTFADVASRKGKDSNITMDTDIHWR